MAGGFEFAPLVESELPAAIIFLRNVFGAAEDEMVRAFRPDVMRWKCFGTHPYWEGSRAYAVRHRGNIVAYGAIAPSEILVGNSAVRTFCLMDWAAHKDFPGTGVLVYTQLQRLADVPLAVGGSEAAKAIIPKLGYRLREDQIIYGRVIRPWKHFRAAKEQNWKSPVKLLRDIAYSSRGTGRTRLSAQRADRFDDRLSPVLPKAGDVLLLRRTVDFLNYALLCPAAEMNGYYIYQGGTLLGYCILSRVGNQCRIADLWIEATNSADWRAAYALATRLASRYPEVTEVVAAVGMPEAQTGIRTAGFRPLQTEPVRARDPRGLLPANKPLSLSLLDNDHYYL